MVAAFLVKYISISSYALRMVQRWCLGVLRNHRISRPQFNPPFGSSYHSVLMTKGRFNEEREEIYDCIISASATVSHQSSW